VKEIGIADMRIGGSATMAVEVLKDRGVPEERILFLNLIASPEGIGGFAKRFPKLRVVTAFIDQVSLAYS
jgi:uracil phosphoribosyltransferase